MSARYTPQETTHTVGVFDSGFGGLTVLRALLPRLPGTHFLYLGDTARLPYGAKSQLTVARYAVESARFLVDQGAHLLVIACNTATALALPEIRAAVPVPVIGVVEPGAQAALAAATNPTRNQHSVITIAAQPSNRVFATEAQPSNTIVSTEAKPSNRVLSTEAKRSGETTAFLSARAEGTSLSTRTTPPSILVLATAATVQSHTYRDTCAILNLDATEMPCPLLVPLVEEGWTDHPVTRDILRIYLTEALGHTSPDAVLLGCTHYPLIAPAITQTLRDLGCGAPVVDSAEATADAVRALQRATRPGHALPSAARASTFTCYATDSTEKFARLGTRFLGQPIPKVHLLDLGG